MFLPNRSKLRCMFLTGLKYFCLAGLVFLIFFLPFNAKGADFSVVINEIAWMGITNSANDEWVELYNNTNNSIALDGWIIKSSDEKLKINLKGAISAKNFYLLERTDDTTVPEIAADLIYKGGLGNSGEDLKLYDNSGVLIDEVSCSGGWFAGVGKPEYKTMERINPLISGNQSSNWQTSQTPAGTPKVKNPAPEQARYGAASEQRTISPLFAYNNEQKTEKLTENSFPPILVYPEEVVLNELLPSPEGPDDKEEWVELFNQNSFEVDLSGWKIEDSSGKITAFTFPKETKISPQGFLVFSRPATKISLNNDGDGLRLLSPDEKTIDSVNYSKAPRGQSYNRTGPDWFWSANLTPGTANITEKTEARPLQDDSASETKEKRELAAIGEQAAKSSKFLFVLLIALGLAIFFGITILILKRKTRKEHSL